MTGPINTRVKIVLYALIALLLVLQYPLWFGNGGIMALWKMQHELTEHKDEIAQLRERNRVLEAEVLDLKQGVEAVEERARKELGMVKKGETFYQIIEPAQK
jgi:cell division protein FtsB